MPLCSTFNTYWSSTHIKTFWTKQFLYQRIDILHIILFYQYISTFFKNVRNTINNTGWHSWKTLSIMKFLYKLTQCRNRKLHTQPAAMNYWVAKKEPRYNLLENKLNHILIQSAKLIMRATSRNIEWKINLLSHIAIQSGKLIMQATL